MSVVPENIRQLVRERAAGRCEYCRKPEIFSNKSFHVDHIISLKHGGISYLVNLAWACLECNVAKGPDIASFDHETGVVVAYFNPRTQIWNHHFPLDGLQIVGLTPAGRVTVRMLQLNSEAQIEARFEIIESGLW